MDQDPGLFATMYTARALRRFKPDSVPEDVVFQLFDAAIRAPSGQNSQDWRFLVVTDDATRAKLGDWAAPRALPATPPLSTRCPAQPASR
jgi:nitroreductase